MSARRVSLEQAGPARKPSVITLDADARRVKKVAGRGGGLSITVESDDVVGTEEPPMNARKVRFLSFHRFGSFERSLVRLQRAAFDAPVSASRSKLAMDQEAARRDAHSRGDQLRSRLLKTRLGARH